MSKNYKEVLTDMGYANIVDNGRELRMKPIYRDSSSSTVLSVRKDTGHFIDFSRNISGSFEYLTQLSLGLKTIEDAKTWLGNTVGSFEKRVQERPSAPAVKILSKDRLNALVPDHSYWQGRGISEDTIKIFKGGMMLEEGRMKNRYVFPIFDSRERLIGVTGRYTLSIPEGSKIPKWKHYPSKKAWKYPLFLNNEIISEKKEVIVVESVGDMLSLWDAGIKNSVVTFGLDISNEMLSSFLRFKVKKVILSFNNDEASNSAGNEAAKKNERKLLRYFDKDQVKISFPTKNDFGEMSKEEIKEWGKNTLYE
tara:strand:- start:4676 stop:5602 length:927 start_codon:yes stop_codon:yes gene_type:complete